VARPGPRAYAPTAGGCGERICHIRVDATRGCCSYGALSGADIARQCLQAGLLDEIVIYLAPVLLGDGVRLYDSVGTEPIALTLTRPRSRRPANRPFASASDQFGGCVWPGQRAQDEAIRRSCCANGPLRLIPGILRYTVPGVASADRSGSILAGWYLPDVAAVCLGGRTRQPHRARIGGTRARLDPGGASTIETSIVVLACRAPDPRLAKNTSRRSCRAWPAGVDMSRRSNAGQIALSASRARGLDDIRAQGHELVQRHERLRALGIATHAPAG
jgi:hypothetical protein